MGGWGVGVVGGVGFVILFVDVAVVFDKYTDVGGANGNTTVNNNSNTTLNTVLNNIVNGNGNTTVNTTVNATMNTKANTLVNGGVSGTTTRTGRVRNTRMRRVASGGKLRTIGIAFSSKVLFAANGTGLDTTTGSTLDGFTGGILGRGESVSMSVCKCASGRN